LLVVPARDTETVAIEVRAEDFAIDLLGDTLVVEVTQDAVVINVEAYVAAAWYLIIAMLYEVCATIFTAKNIKLSNDRVGLTRSAIFLVFLWLGMG